MTRIEGRRDNTVNNSNISRVTARSPGFVAGVTPTLIFGTGIGGTLGWATDKGQRMNNKIKERYSILLKTFTLSALIC